MSGTTRSLLALALCAALPGSAAADASVRTSDGRYLMGTVLEIDLCGQERPAAEPLLERLFAEVARLERVSSTWDPTSEVSRLNDRAGAGPQHVSDDLADLLDTSVAASELTQGAFDITVAPLVSLWRRTRSENRVPDAARLALARARVGSAALRVDRHRHTAELATPGMAIDLGGIAKGWALDRLVGPLEASGATGALLDFGQSSIYAHGSPDDAPRWRLLLRAPDGSLAGVVSLRDQALSVSATHAGRLIDPHTGIPVSAERLAAVVAPSGALAEALSTALAVLGTDGVALIDGLDGADALLLDPDGRHETSGWRARTRYEPWQPDLLSSRLAPRDPARRTPSPDR